MACFQIPLPLPVPVLQPQLLLGGRRATFLIHNSSIPKFSIVQTFSSPRLPFQLHQTHYYYYSRQFHKPYATPTPTSHLSPDLEDRDTNTTMEGVSVSSTTMEGGAIKMKISVSGAKSEAIFDNVFSKMVSAAQPIPGFRRVKGGKTPNIRRDVLIQILGPSKVYKQVIKKIINSTVAEYVEKQKLKVTKDLRVEQSFEELEAAFVPGEEFRFDASTSIQVEGEE